jgi:RNA-binding protein
MAATLTSKDRARLKAQAHALEPVVQVGTAGITPSVITEADRALTAHELIKVKIAGDDRAARTALGDELCERTGATAVHRVGKVLIAWRPRPEDEDEAPPRPKRPRS